MKTVATVRLAIKFNEDSQEYGTSRSFSRAAATVALKKGATTESELRESINQTVDNLIDRMRYEGVIRGPRGPKVR